MDGIVTRTNGFAVNQVLLPALNMNSCVPLIFLVGAQVGGVYAAVTACSLALLWWRHRPFGELRKAPHRRGATARTHYNLAYY